MTRRVRWRWSGARRGKDNARTGRSRRSQRSMLARQSGICGRRRHFDSSRVVTFTEKVDAPSRSLLTLGCLDPSAVDVESDAVVAGIVMVTSNAAVVTSVAGAQNLLWFVLCIVIILSGCSGGTGILPVLFRVVLRHASVRVYGVQSANRLGPPTRRDEVLQWQRKNGGWADNGGGDGQAESSASGVCAGCRSFC